MNVYDFESSAQSAIWALGPAEGSSKQTLGSVLGCVMAPETQVFTILRS